MKIESRPDTALWAPTTQQSTSSPSLGFQRDSGNRQRPPRDSFDWNVARRIAAAWLRDRHQFFAGKVPRTCPICGHIGIMIGVGRPTRWDARCAKCGSRERHRLLWLWNTRDGGNRLATKKILHFAPEKALRRALSANPRYETADLQQPGVTYPVNITDLPMADETYDVIIANHVLEHIDDDRQALRELHRILRPSGIALLTVPINPSRTTTYEDASITERALRRAHFTAPDHRRYYGTDFADRLAGSDFNVETFRVPPPLEVRYGLLPMEWLYVATRAPTPGSVSCSLN